MARVLVVDDEVIARMALKETLERAGHEVIGEAINGNDALEKYTDLKPEIVFMDIMMPECDGLEGIKKIKAHDSKAKIIMATALGSLKNIVEALNLGAVDYVNKPFKDSNIIRAIDRALRI